ncbi:MAG: bifunctional riboflavin kinase/FAD synthetase, partial [Actinomycetota bacterium]|nr:bifunctional riboflavin kinase/FAD synthetase [Actinomycetota bacterium]
MPPEPSAVTIGFFDGVHRGHQLLVDRTSRHAASRSLRTVAATFDRHPTQVTRPGSEPPLLMTLERRVRTLHEVGADLVLVIPFTVELSELSPAGFVDEVLCNALNAHVVVVGENFRFGHLAVGDVGALSSIGLDRGLEVDVVELL